MAKIVCVEDEEQIRAVLVEELTDIGHEVIETRNGKEGLDAILQHEPDLVICDWLMPSMTGLELFTALKVDRPQFADLPFVFVSAHANKEHVETGLSLGADAYFTKPVDLERLLNTVTLLLERAAR